jgi:hypothetical protein
VSPDDLAHAVSAGTNDVAGRTRCLHPCRTCREADRQEISIAALLFPWLMPLRKRSAHRWPGALPHTPLRAPGPATTSTARHCSALRRGNVIVSSLAKLPHQSAWQRAPRLPALQTEHHEAPRRRARGDCESGAEAAVEDPPGRAACPSKERQSGATRRQPSQ